MQCRLVPTFAHGGSPLKALKFVTVTAALLLLAATIASADGVGDTRIVQSTGPGHSPPCGSLTAMVNNAGLLSTDCKVTSVAMGGTGTVTTFSFEVLDSDTFSAGLTCVSQLTSVGWTGVLASHNPGGVDICTLTAPTTVSKAAKDFMKSIHDPYTGKNDGDCDLDDVVLGVIVGCDIIFSNPSTPQDPNLFVAGATVGLSADNGMLPILPEPGTVSLMLIGLAGLPMLRRRLAR